MTHPANRVPPFLCPMMLALLAVQTATVQQAAAQPAPHKRALLVGVSEYERSGPSDWWNLNCGLDVETLRALLVSKFGFEPGDIMLLTSREETTARSIIDAFRTHLIEATQPGDVVYFHYSGHGAQMLDDNGDEPDGLDETLIPSDYVSRQDHSHDIRDDLLGTLINQLEARKPGSLLLTFDCCFSGTNTRGGRMLTRGAAWQGPPPPLPKRRGGEAHDADGPSGLFAPKEGTRNTVVIAATRSDQVANETSDDSDQPMGLLTYAISNALADATPTTTYRDVFERVADLMARRSRDQQPQLEGDMDRVVMSGLAAPPQPYITAKFMGDALVLSAGKLHGVTKGSRYAIYPPGTKDFAKATPLAEAEITMLDFTSALFGPTSSPLPDMSGSSGAVFRAVEREHRYDDKRLAVAVPELGATRPEDPMLKRLRGLPLVNIVDGDAWDVRLRSSSRAGETGATVLERMDGSVIVEIPRGGDAPAVVARALEGEARWRFLQSLESDDPASDVRIALRLVPVDVQLDARGNPTRVTGRRDLPRDAGGNAELRPGTYFIIELMNPGRADAYATVLDLRGDGRVGPLWPDPSERNDNNMVPADSKWRSVPIASPASPWIFVVENTPGREVIKVIATREQTDFSPVLDPEMVRGARDGTEPAAAKTPLGRLLKAATAGQRAARASVDPAEWATASTMFRVVP